jgi:hypothetical protein
MKKYIVTLTLDEQDSLSELASKGKHGSQEILNALILLGPTRASSRKSAPPTKK